MTVTIHFVPPSGRDGMQGACQSHATEEKNQCDQMVEVIPLGRYDPKPGQKCPTGYCSSYLVRPRPWSSDDRY